MNTVVQVKDKKFALYISEDTIKTRVKEVAAQIDADLRKKNPLFLVYSQQTCCETSISHAK